MLNELEEYYKGQGIYSIGFHCKHLESCLSKVDNPHEFTKGKAAYVGQKYEEGLVPRLLFLSLDAGAQNEDPVKRTLIGVRGETEKNPLTDGKHKHWYKTHEFACSVFNELCGEKRFGVHQIKPYFAHTNSAKCCMNNPHNAEANSTLFHNCREYILPEIEILAPEVVVTQGNRAWDVIATELNKKITPLSKEMNLSHNPDYDLREIEYPKNKRVMWVHHYHPRSGRYFAKNLEKYEVYAKEIATFLRKHYPKKVKNV